MTYYFREILKCSLDCSFFPELPLLHKTMMLMNTILLKYELACSSSLPAVFMHWSKESDRMRKSQTKCCKTLGTEQALTQQIIQEIIQE